MRKYIYIAFLLVLCSGRTSAQFTLVSGTVTDTNSLLYACGTISASIVNNNGQSLYLNGVQFSPQPGATKLGCQTDPSTATGSPGSYTMQLADNTQLKCGSGASIVTCASQTQWLFTVNTTGILPPLGTGPQTCTLQATISGTSQVLNLTSCPTLLATGSTTNQPNGAVPGPPYFNVKAYGTPGVTGTSVESDNCSTNGTTTLNCTDVTFTPANVTNRVSCATVFSTQVNPTTTFTAFIDATHMTMSAASGAAGGLSCLYGPPDDAAVLAATNAAAAAVQSKTSFQGNLAPILDSCLYFPAGSYNLLTTSISFNPIPPKSGFCILGDNIDATKLYWNTGTNLPATGAAITASGNVGYIRIDNLTMDGANGTHGLSNAAMFFGGGATADIHNVHIQRFGANAFFSSGTVYASELATVANQGDGIICNPCNGEFYKWTSSNNGAINVHVSNTHGEPTGAGVKFVNGLDDEGSSLSPFTVQASTDVWVIGSSLFSGSNKAAGNGCISVDGTSYVHENGGLCGVFGNDSNENGAFIATGGVLEATDVRFVGMGTAKCIVNNGTVVNNGANTCESIYATISAAASVGNTATLTVNTAPNVNCSVGDTLQVENVGVAGYNGVFKNAVTAVTGTTVSYTTPGSNLGASSGGSAFCKGYVTYSGNLPFSTITPTQNTCYVTGTFAAITLCNPFIDRGINIYHIKASSGVTTACTVAPVVTISDGTNSATLTITTAKSSWDSSVDASSGVGNTIYTPHGGTITVTTTSGTCTTAPTNFSLTYTMQAVLDNQ